MGTSTNDQSSSALVGMRKKKFLAKARKPRVCYNCEQTGHFRRDCPKLKKDELITRPNPSHKAKTAEEQLDSSDTNTDNAGAFAASHGTMKSLHMGKWLIDSKGTLGTVQRIPATRESWFGRWTHCSCIWCWQCYFEHEMWPRWKDSKIGSTQCIVCAQAHLQLIHGESSCCKRKPSEVR